MINWIDVVLSIAGSVFLFGIWLNFFGFHLDRVEKKQRAALKKMAQQSQDLGLYDYYPEKDE